MHEGKKFRVGDFRVTWDRGQNWLLSPYFELSGRSVIDWARADFAERQKLKVKVDEAGQVFFRIYFRRIGRLAEPKSAGIMGTESGGVAMW